MEGQGSPTVQDMLRTSASAPGGSDEWLKRMAPYDVLPYAPIDAKLAFGSHTKSSTRSFAIVSGSEQSFGRCNGDSHYVV